MNDSRKNKIFQNLIKKIFTDIQPKFTFQLVSFCMILNCSFPSILVIKPPSTWNEPFGELTQSKEILRKHQKSFELDTGYRQNGKSQTGCSDSRKLRVKISKTIGSWRFEDWMCLHIHIEDWMWTKRDSWKIPDCPLPIQQAFPPQWWVFWERVNRRDSQRWCSPAKLFDNQQGTALIPNLSPLW